MQAPARPVISAIIILVFMAGAPLAQAQQDVEMPREVRALVQKGLAHLGFDPGPADGLFSRKTRAAIWDWQAAKELDTTGYLTQPEAEALAAVGAEVDGKRQQEREASQASAPRNQVWDDLVNESRNDKAKHSLVVQFEEIGDGLQMPSWDRDAWRDLTKRIHVNCEFDSQITMSSDSTTIYLTNDPDSKEAKICKSSILQLQAIYRKVKGLTD